jgi:DNA-binding NtrC family response regulator
MTKEHLRYRILVIDDDREIAEMHAEMLHRMGYTAVVCTKPMDALTLFCTASERFDAVILDEIMPDIRGTEIAERLLEAKHDIPIILITGRGDAVSLEQLRRCGVRATLIKPVLREDLRTTLERLL